MDSTELDGVALGEAMNAASELFDQMAVDRHEAGAEKYGAFKFLGANTLEEAMEEVVDLANYARYTFIKLYLLNGQISAAAVEHQDTPIGDLEQSKPTLLGEQ